MFLITPLLLLLLLSFNNNSNSTVYAQKVAVCSAKRTKPDDLGFNYLPKSPRTKTIGPAEELADRTKRLSVTGRVLSTRNCSRNKRNRLYYYPVSNVNLEVWYAGKPDDDNWFVYHPDKYRGQLQTNRCGYFSFVQVFPTINWNRPILHTHIRLSATKKKKELLTTQIYYHGQEDGYYNNYTLQNWLGNDKKDLQVVTIQTKSDGTRSIVFDIFLDVDGNTNCTKVTSSVQPRRLF